VVFGIRGGMFKLKVDILLKGVFGKYGWYVNCGAVCVNENVVLSYVSTRSAMSMNARELKLTKFSLFLNSDQDRVYTFFS
jgi:hypothetical protein